MRILRARRGEAGQQTNGQKPEKDWVEYLNQLPTLKYREIVLFTTYKILTGSMFREMKKHLPDEASVSLIKLKSRNGKLTDANRQLIRLLTDDPPHPQPLSGARFAHGRGERFGETDN